MARQIQEAKEMTIRDERFWVETRKELQRQSKQMSRELKRALRGRTIKDVLVNKKVVGEVYIKLVTNKGPVVIGACDLGVWVGKEEAFKRDHIFYEKLDRVGEE